MLKIVCLAGGGRGADDDRGERALDIPRRSGNVHVMNRAYGIPVLLGLVDVGRCATFQSALLLMNCKP